MPFAFTKEHLIEDIQTHRMATYVTSSRPKLKATIGDSKMNAPSSYGIHGLIYWYIKRISSYETQLPLISALF